MVFGPSFAVATFGARTVRRTGLPMSSCGAKPKAWANWENSSADLRLRFWKYTAPCLFSNDLISPEAVSFLISETTSSIEEVWSVLLSE